MACKKRFEIFTGRDGYKESFGCFNDLSSAKARGSSEYRKFEGSVDTRKRYRGPLAEGNEIWIRDKKTKKGWGLIGEEWEEGY